jgi:hypothetical protein
MRKILGIIIFITFWPTLSFSASTAFSDAVGGDEFINACVTKYSFEFDNKETTKTYCTCVIDYLDRNISEKQLNNLKSEKEAAKLITKITKKGRNHCVKKVTNIKTESKKLENSGLTKEKIIDKYKSSLPKCEGGEADMGKDILRWTKWNNCLGTIKLIDESGDELTFISEFKNGEMIGIFIGTLRNGTLFAVRNKRGCKKNGHQIIDGTLSKVKLNKDCDVTKIIYLD